MDFQGPNMNAYSQKHTNCHFGWWHKLNSADKRMTFYQEREKKRPRKKGVARKSKNAC